MVDSLENLALTSPNRPGGASSTVLVAAPNSFDPLSMAAIVGRADNIRYWLGKFPRFDLERALRNYEVIHPAGVHIAAWPSVTLVLPSSPTTSEDDECVAGKNRFFGFTTGKPL